MARCLVSIGANLGDAAATVRQAAKRLRQTICCSPDALRLSRLYHTAPVGGPEGQPPFINAVAAVETGLPAPEVGRAIRMVESELGRTRNRRWEARHIDLDLLLYEDERIWTDALKVPHPRLCMRRFILIPATDVASDWREPISGMTLGTLARRLIASTPSICLHGTGTRRGMELVERLKNSLKTHAKSSEVPVERFWLTECQPCRESVAPWAIGRREGETFGLRDCFSGAPLLHIVLVTSGGKPFPAWRQLYRRVLAELGAKEHQGPAHASGNEGGLGIAPEHPPIRPPVYLLECDDVDWAVHEVKAAIEAMQCQVIPCS